MKCVIFLVATTILCLIGITTSTIRQRRGYYGYPYQDTNIHTPWWRGYKVHNRQDQPSGPYDAFGINREDFSDDEDSDGENRPIIEPTPIPGTINTGNMKWLGAWGVPSTEKPRPDPFRLSTDKALEQIELCIRSCSITTEYNPVCGSNNLTYTNPGRLECAQRCGVDVELSRLSACSVPVPTDPGFHASMEVLEACIRQCPMTTEYNPVCGSNNVTYANPGRLMCEQNCGVPVQLSKLSPCTSLEQSTQKIEEQLSACISSCPVTAEYNPVCGSNNVTYTNLGRLECAQNCGIVVYVSRQTSCEAPITKDIDPVNATRDFNVTRKNTTDINLIRTTNSTTARPFINKNGNNSFEWGNTDKKANNSEDSNDINNKNNPNRTNNLNGENVGKHTEGKNNYNDLNCANKSSINGDNDVSGGDNRGNDETSVTGKYDNGYGSDSNDGNEENNGAPETKGYHSSSGHYGGNIGHGGNNYNGGHGGYNGNHGHHPGNNNCNGINNQKIPSVKEVMACMQLCSLSSEYNPVCGTDDITYMNPGRLLCAQFCGIDVRAKKFAPCFSTSNTNFHCPTICTNPPVTESPGTNTPSPAIQACIDACPASTEFKPVCGSNNITYRNLEKMQCAIRCGIDVSLQRNSQCSAPDANPNSSHGSPPISNSTEKPTNSSPQAIQECIEKCSVPQNYEPICGSDNVTYNNTGHLICARQCGYDVRVIRLSPCNKDESPSTNPTTAKEPVSPNPDSLNFTIPLDVLDSIWSETTAAKNDSEEFDLDQRVQD